MGLKTAGGEYVIGLDHLAGHIKPLFPMIPNRICVNPIFIFQILEIEDPEVQILGQIEHAQLLHHFISRRRAAPFTDHDLRGIPFFELQDKLPQSIDMCGSREGVSRVEIRFHQDAFSLDPGRIEKPQRFPDPLFPVTGLDECNPCFLRSSPRPERSGCHGS